MKIRGCDILELENVLCITKIKIMCPSCIELFSTNCVCLCGIKIYDPIKNECLFIDLIVYISILVISIY